MADSRSIDPTIKEIQMDITVMEATAAITATLLWLSVIDIAILVNVASWYGVTLLINEIRRIK